MTVTRGPGPSVTTTSQIAPIRVSASHPVLVLPGSHVGFNLTKRSRSQYPPNLRQLDPPLRHAITRVFRQSNAVIGKSTKECREFRQSLGRWRRHYHGRPNLCLMCRSCKPPSIRFATTGRYTRVDRKSTNEPGHRRSWSAVSGRHRGSPYFSQIGFLIFFRNSAWAAASSSLGAWLRGGRGARSSRAEVSTAVAAPRPREGCRPPTSSR